MKFEDELHAVAWDRVKELASYISDEQLVKMVAEKRSETYESVRLGAKFALDSRLVRDMAEASKELLTNYSNSVKEAERCGFRTVLINKHDLIKLADALIAYDAAKAGGAG